MANPITPFDQGLAKATGLDPRVVAAWRAAEGGPSDNPLNIGPGRHYSDPVGATANLINTSGYYKGIRASKNDPGASIAAIKASPWDAAHYSNGVLDRTSTSYGIKAGVGNYIATGQTPGIQVPQNDNKQALMKYIMASSAAMAQGQKSPSIVNYMSQAQSSGPLNVQVDHNEPLSPHAGTIVGLAQKYMGTKYTWGGSNPQTGFDCSGFVQWLYKQEGVNLGRTTYDQIKQGKPVDRNNLAPGDVVFFSQNGDVHHEGLYIGHNQFIAAPHTGDVVKISSLNDPYYASQFAGGRRMM